MQHAGRTPRASALRRLGQKGATSLVARVTLVMRKTRVTLVTRSKRVAPVTLVTRSTRVELVTRSTRVAPVALVTRVTLVMLVTGFARACQLRSGRPKHEHQCQWLNATLAIPLSSQAATRS